ncbi:hypothetical protein PTKU46_86070 [Paraburkholderia terrae]
MRLCRVDGRTAGARDEVVAIEGESYRVKEARERAEQRATLRNAVRPEKKP